MSVLLRVNQRCLLAFWGVALTGCMGGAVAPEQGSNDLPDVRNIFRDMARLAFSTYCERLTR